MLRHTLTLNEQRDSEGSRAGEVIVLWACRIFHVARPRCCLTVEFAIIKTRARQKNINTLCETEQKLCGTNGIMCIANNNMKNI